MESLFLKKTEAEKIHANRNTEPFRSYLWRLYNLAARWSETPGPVDHHARFEWYFVVPTAVQMTAMAYALKPEDSLRTWLRSSVLTLVRMSDDAWVGPWFRNHSARPFLGHLETGHLSATVAVAFDLAREVFTEAEQDEIATCLRDRAIPMCMRYLDTTPRAMNWCTIMLHGVATAAAVLDERETIDRCVEWFNVLTGLWQPDGSYGESQQYANYSALGLMWSWESIVRRDAARSASMDISPYARTVRWWTHGRLFDAPLDGAGAHDRPRVANFHDCSAVFRPAADLLLHIARNAPAGLKTERALAMWLFSKNHTPAAFEDFHDLEIHALRNDFGFLTLPLLVDAPEALSPEKAGLDTVQAFSNGECFARQSFSESNRTVLAVQGGGEPMNVCNHRHYSANSFILAHNYERLLADPGHSCYRSTLRRLDLSTMSHNTCTFGAREQINAGRVRAFTSDRQGLAQPSDPVGYPLISSRVDDVVVIGYDCAAAYDEVITRFARFWVLCGAHAVFVVDRISATQPVGTTWHWTLDNRDGRLTHKVGKTQNLVVRRGDAGMKLFHVGPGEFAGPVYGFLHDWYSPEPAQMGEGTDGTGIGYTVRDPEQRTDCTMVHAIGMGTFGGTASWHLRKSDDRSIVLDGAPEAERVSWRLEIDDESAPALSVVNETAGKAYTMFPSSSGRWEFTVKDR